MAALRMCHAWLCEGLAAEAALHMSDFRSGSKLASVKSDSLKKTGAEAADSIVIYSIHSPWYRVSS